MKRALRAGLALGVLWMCLTVSAAARADMARLIPEDAIVYAELREPKAVLKLLEGWLKGIAGPMGDPMAEGMGQAAKELGMTAEQLRAEIEKAGGVAFAFTGIDMVEEAPLLMVMGDLRQSALLREALAKKMAGEADGIAATVQGVNIYSGDEDAWTCVVDGYVMIATRRSLVEATIKRVKAQGGASLATSTRFRKIHAELDPRAVAVAYVDAPMLHKLLQKVQVEEEEVAAVDAALDLKTIECLFASLTINEKTTLIKSSLIFNGPNRTYAALRTRTGARSAERFFSDKYGLVTSGTLINGRAQWRSFRDVVTRTMIAAGEDADDFVTGVGELEKALDVKVEDELANVTEYGVGLMGGKRGFNGPPDVLFAVKVKDVARVRALMAKVEKVATDEIDGLVVREKDVEGVKVRYAAADEVDSDYAYAIAGDWVLLSNHEAAVSNAIRTRKSNKCILDAPGAKKVLANLQDPNAKLLLINVMGILGDVPRNENAPPPAMFGVTSVEKPLRIDIVEDVSQFGDLIRLFFGLMMQGMRM